MSGRGRWRLPVVRARAAATPSTGKPEQAFTSSNIVITPLDQSVDAAAVRCAPCSAAGSVAALVRRKAAPIAPRAGGEQRADEEGHVVAARRARRDGSRPRLPGCAVRDAARLARTARPSAPPIMNAVLTTPEARPDFLRRDVAHRGEQHRVEGDAGAEAEQDHARQHVDDEVPVDRRAREQREADCGEQQTRPRAAA